MSLCLFVLLFSVCGIVVCVGVLVVAAVVAFVVVVVVVVVVIIVGVGVSVVDDAVVVGHVLMWRFLFFVFDCVETFPLFLSRKIQACFYKIDK